MCGIYRQRRPVPQAEGRRSLRFCPGGTGVRPAGRRDDGRRFDAQCAELERARLAEKKVSKDSWVKLARLSLETFVSLHAHGQLRGCIGTTRPTTENVAWEIVQNAISACARDPRFTPVAVSELNSLEYSVDVLGHPEPIASQADLDVKRYGVIISCSGRWGLLLPNLEGVDTIKKKPLRRFRPGSMILSVGSFGCNLRCPFCQNHKTSMSGDGDLETEEVSSETLADKALELQPYGNIGVAYTYNEPLIGYKYVRDCAALVRERGMVNVLVTNGAIEEAPWWELLPLIDAANIDLKDLPRSGIGDWAAIWRP